MTVSSDALLEQIARSLKERDAYRRALHSIANINNGPDRASGEYRCIEAAEIAQAALMTPQGQRPDKDLKDKLFDMMIFHGIAASRTDTFDELINELTNYLYTVNGKIQGAHADIILAANKRIHQLRDVLEWTENNCPGKCAEMAREVLENTN